MKQMNNTEKGNLKELIFSLYCGQKIVHQKANYFKPSQIDVSNSILGLSKDIYLQLKPLSSITFEDAVEAIIFDRSHYGYAINSGRTNENIKIIDVQFNKSFTGTGLYYHYKFTDFSIESGSLMFSSTKGSVVEFLRSKGYALPYLNYSVANLVELGFIKLDECDNKDGKKILTKNYDVSLVSETKYELVGELNKPEIPTECLEGWSNNMYCDKNKGTCENCK